MLLLCVHKVTEVESGVSKFCGAELRIIEICFGHKLQQEMLIDHVIISFMFKKIC